MYLVIGDTAAAHRVRALLTEQGRPHRHLVSPTEDDLCGISTRPIAGVAVMVHHDVEALRYALTVAHLWGEGTLVVTIFDRTIGEELERLLPHGQVISPGDLAAPMLAARLLTPALDDGSRQIVDANAGGPVGSVRISDYRLRSAQQRRRDRRGVLAGQLRPQESSARLVLIGSTGLAAIMLADWLWLVLRRGYEPAAALYAAVRVVTTVGPAHAAPNDSAYLIGASLAMLAALALTALLMAGLVERVLSDRLVGILGRRVIPRSGHVIVVGIGQVGFRLCAELRQVGVPVVGVERRSTAHGVHLARRAGIPVMTGDGTERELLQRLQLSKAIGLAATGSDDLDNVAVAVAAQGVARHAPIVIRAGEHAAIAETRSLLPLGSVCDVAQLTATHTVARLTARPTPAPAQP